MKCADKHIYSFIQLTKVLETFTKLFPTSFCLIF